MTILTGILLTIHIIACILLVLIILMQRPRNEGLGTTFGGGVTDTLFGSGAGNVLTKITTWLALIFFATTISLAWINSHRESGKSLKSHLIETTVPADDSTKANTSAPLTLPPSQPAAIQPPEKKGAPAAGPVAPATSPDAAPESEKKSVK